MTSRLTPHKSTMDCSQTIFLINWASTWHGICRDSITMKKWDLLLELLKSTGKVLKLRLILLLWTSTLMPLIACHSSHSQYNMQRIYLQKPPLVHKQRTIKYGKEVSPGTLSTAFLQPHTLLFINGMLTTLPLCNTTELMLLLFFSTTLHQINLLIYMLHYLPKKQLSLTQ